jgi:hypothetical protein
MYNGKKPDPSELPSTSRLLKSTGIAALVAAILIVTIVLPAEYGIDPTRLGSAFGLTEMGRIKQQLATEAEAAEMSAPTIAASLPNDESVASPPAEPLVAETALQTAVEAAPAVPQWKDEVSFTLEPDAAAEFKLVMKERASATFEWFTDGTTVNYDTHGDRPGVSYHGYGKGSAARLEGELVAAFDGSHGWYWRNRSGAPLMVTLRTRGDYSEVKRVL